MNRLYFLLGAVALCGTHMESLGFNRLKKAKFFSEHPVINAADPAESMKNAVTSVKKVLETLHTMVENVASSVELNEIMNRQVEDTKQIQSPMKKFETNIKKQPRPSLALNKPTKSSSAFHTVDSSLAVDGSGATNWGSKSCFHFDFADTTQWWQVDLATHVEISEVKVTARSDCCAGRLHDFAVEVFDDDPSVSEDAKSQLCIMYDKTPAQAGETLSLHCKKHVTGRYLRITGTRRRKSEDVLQFCEVQVFGP